MLWLSLIAGGGEALSARAGEGSAEGDGARVGGVTALTALLPLLPRLGEGAFQLSGGPDSSTSRGLCALPLALLRVL